MTLKMEPDIIQEQSQLINKPLEGLVCPSLLTGVNDLG